MDLPRHYLLHQHASITSAVEEELETQGPLKAYKKMKEDKLLRQDPRQEATILELQHLYEEFRKLHPSKSSRGLGLTLVEAHQPTRKGGFWSSLFNSEGNDPSFVTKPTEVKGMYMFGGVGVGKTFLMDLFVSTCPPTFKLQRTHFHDFMLDVHYRLRRHSGTSDPLTAVGDDIMKETRLLCLDELFVTDVADAMILHRLFDRLWDRGLTLIATSNRAPDSLYEGGLQRALFLPFIERLKKECIIHDMASPVDYRRLASHRSGLYFVSPSREEDLWDRFVELTNQNPIKALKIEVAMGRFIELPKVGGCIAYFTFQELCGRPLGAADYIAVAIAKHTVAISGIPIFTASTRSEAYRFVILIDVFYEHKVRLLCSAEAMPSQLFEHVKSNSDAKASSGDQELLVDDNLGFTKDRTISRLIEMQSREYLKMHAKEWAPELLLALSE